MAELQTRVTVDLLPTTLAFPLITQRGVVGDGDMMSTHLPANVRYGKPSCMHAYMHADRMTILYSICTNMYVDEAQRSLLVLHTTKSKGHAILYIPTMATVVPILSEVKTIRHRENAQRRMDLR
jgi:hypothetical protein